MKKRLIIHLGAGKCGSSAIQAYLALNKEVLLKQKVLILGKNLDLESECLGDQIWFLQNGVKQEDFSGVVSRRLRRIHNHLVEQDLDTTIVSAENLINPEGFEKLFSGLRGIYDIELLLYVRRQDEYMISAWQQWYLKAFGSFEEYVNKLGSRVDWDRAIAPWENTFGAESITVRSYQKDRLKNGNVVDDFMSFANLSMDDCESITRKINRSLDEKFNVIANKYRQDLFTSIHDNEFYEFLVATFGENAYKNYKGSSELTLAQREFILEIYRESNQRIFDKYIQGREEHESLFSPPTTADVYSRDDVASVVGDSDYMFVGMFGLYKQMKKLQAA